MLDHDILLSLIAWMLCKIFGNFHQLTSLHHITYGNSCFQLSTLLPTCLIQFLVPKLDFYVPLDYTVSKTVTYIDLLLVRPNAKIERIFCYFKY